MLFVFLKLFMIPGTSSGTGFGATSTPSFGATGSLSFGATTTSASTGKYPLYALLYIYFYWEVEMRCLCHIVIK